MAFSTLFMLPRKLLVERGAEVFFQTSEALLTMDHKSLDVFGNFVIVLPPSIE